VILPVIVVFCMCAVFCITPLAMYLTWLGSVNRRSKTTVIAGEWDFALLLSGLSGFILFGGGVLVAALQSNLRFAARGNWEQLQQAWGEERLVWGALALAYFVVVAAGVLLGVLLRSRSLVVFNIDRGQAELAVDEVLAGVGVPAPRFGNVWATSHPLVQLDFFHIFRHATIKIVCPDPRLGEEIERGLRLRLPLTPTADGAAAGWMLSASITLMVSVLCSILLLAYFLYLTR